MIHSIHTCINGFLLVHYHIKKKGGKGLLRHKVKFPDLVKSGGCHGNKNINITKFKCSCGNAAINFL